MMIENQDILSSSEGAKPSNRLKNRYKDILPCKFKKKQDYRSNGLFQMINIELFFNRIMILIISMHRILKYDPFLFLS